MWECQGRAWIARDRCEWLWVGVGEGRDEYEGPEIGVKGFRWVWRPEMGVKGLRWAVRA